MRVVVALWPSCFGGPTLVLDSYDFCSDDLSIIIWDTSSNPSQSSGDGVDSFGPWYSFFGTDIWTYVVLNFS